MDLDIRAQTIDFVADGSWRSMTLMAGRWDGMRLEASGTWSLSGSTLTYTAGENRDATQISMDDGKLSLRPDLLVRRNGTDPVNATYVR